MNGALKALSQTGSLALMMLGGLLSPPVFGAHDWTLDGENSTAKFRVDVAGFSTVEGIAPKIQGSLDLSPELRISGLQIRIPMSTVTTGSDLLDPMLKSRELLDTASFPEAYFEGDETTALGDAHRVIEGRLQMKGHQAPVKWTVSEFHCVQKEPTVFIRCSGEAHTQIRRSDFGLQSLLGLVSESIDVSVSVNALGKFSSP